MSSPGLSQSSSSARKPPQKRSSKACETCRARRIRCVGPPPCEPCVAAGLGRNCVVRVKARPRRITAAIDGVLASARLDVTWMQTIQLVSANTRAPSSKMFMRNSEAVEPPPQAELTSPATKYAEKRNPLDELEAALGVWCGARGVPFSQLVFKEDTRLTGMPGSPLPSPPRLREFEDRLMQDLLRTSIDAEAFDHRNAADDRVLQSLYGRYRSIPSSLTDDQRALIYAVLCAGHFNQFRARMAGGEPVPEDQRQDVTYYHMAYLSLANCNQPSLVAMWALFYLTPFTIEMGGPAETKDLVSQMAWHIRELGLHRQATAALYPPQDQVIFAAFFYTEMIRASLIDLRPVIPFSELDIDPSPPPNMFPDLLVRASYSTAQFLSDYADPTVDTTSISYIAAAETSWAPYLRDARHGDQSVQPTTVAWAQFRYNWLRVLLYLPLISHATLAPLAYAALARSVSQILHTYSDLANIKQVRPSWPQVHRLVICGQLLILCHDAGELHVREAEVLFQLLVDLLAHHQPLWPVCLQLLGGFSAAAASFGINVHPQTSFAFPEVLDGTPVDSNTFGWPFNIGMDFDVGQLPF